MRLIAAALVMVTAGLALAAGELKPYAGGDTPTLELAALDGHLHRLGDYRGQVVLVNFWASWCPPCREEMPSMQRLTDRLRGRPFAVLAVNIGEDAATVRSFLKESAVDFPILLDIEGRAPGEWKVFAFPSSFLIGRDGRIRYTLYGALEWDAPEVVAVVEGLLGGSTPSSALPPAGSETP